MKIKIDNSGISLALTIGLLLLLISMTATLNVLVIRSIRSARQIEASDKAYFAAESGIEDALYELSAHSAGYETVDLDDANGRSDDFTKTVDWKNEWEIKNKGLNTCDGSLTTWENSYSPDYCGRIYGGKKLVINLFNDKAVSTGITDNEINEAVSNIKSLNISSFTMKIRLPVSLVADNSIAKLSIDNDGDLGTSSKSGIESILGLNEDGVSDTSKCGGTTTLDDSDCDGKEDEDSPEDPVVLWKLVDDAGNSFQPLRGCKGDASHPSHSDTNASLCEKNFSLTGSELSVTFSNTDKGIDNAGFIKTLANFLNGYSSSSTKKLQMEILIVAPMETVLAVDETIPIPYYEYGIDFPDTVAASVPSTYFSIKSNGYYRDFKQSITTNVTPRATSRLLDLTIIQQ